MARRRYFGKRRGHGKPKSLGIMLGLAAGVGVTAGLGAWNGYKSNSSNPGFGALAGAVYETVGYDMFQKKFVPQQAVKGVGIIAACVAGGYVMHKLASMSGFNRYLPKGYRV